MSLYTQDGLASLLASSLGESYILDPAKLSFVAWPHGSHSAPLPLTATIGAPSYIPPDGSGVPAECRLKEYALRVSFGEAPGPPGLYDVELQTADGFAKTDRGVSLPYRDSSRFPESRLLGTISWPRDPDVTLARARAEFVGRNVYGYGGISIACPHWSNAYEFNVPVLIRAVERDTGQLEDLSTGPATDFFAVSPLRFVVDVPSIQPLAQGGTSGDSRNEPGSGSCPGFVLADWQVDRTIGLSPPPVPFDPSRDVRRNSFYPEIAVGMTRDDVAWRIGYPSDFADRAAIDRESVWTYEQPPPGGFTVTFRDGKVIAFTKPAMPP